MTALAVVLAVALVMWLLAERTARHQGRRVARLQQRVRAQRREIRALLADLDEPVTEDGEGRG